LLLLPALCHAQASSNAEILERLERIERDQAELKEQLKAKDAEIEELKSELKRSRQDTDPSTAPAAAPQAKPEEKPEEFGKFGFGRGFQVVNTKYGSVWLSAYSYVRYLNQKALNDSFTDEFGRSREIDARNDLQLQKAVLYTKGWVYDPKLSYVFYVWSSNTSQGDGAQVVVAGYLDYRIADVLHLGAGVAALPSVRSTRGSWPFFLKVDHRTTADEFFRGSYTQGAWASGKLAEGLHYKLMVGNNLSALGISAAELDDEFATVSGSVWWMPTTGEFGYREGFGDYDQHRELATTLGAQFTFSREDKQSQSDEDDPENTQIRLSDGTVVFSPDAFAPGTQVDKLSYYMSSFDAGLKYEGFSLEGEYYLRWLDDLSTTGLPLPDEDFFDHGFQLQASAMLVPKTLQLYATGSKIFGEFGNPSDASLGLNWYPFKIQFVRLAGEVIYTSASPVGYSSIPMAVGGHGPIFNTNLELYF
jgi:hypothetical protein